MPGLKPGFGKLATLGEVFDILYSNLPNLQIEQVRLQDVLHRVLASDAVAEVDVPHFVKAAMDGFAVVASDTFGSTDADPKVLRIIDSVSPGNISTKKVEPGTCIEIGTGAPMPDGADAVVMVEYTEPADEKGSVIVRKGVAPSENIITVGSDVSAGSIVLRRGTLLQPRHLGVLAAIGLSSVGIFAKPKIGLFSTGPEIIEAGGKLELGRIFDINTHTLRGALEVDGCEVMDFGIVPDEIGKLEAVVNESLQQADMMLLSGGSSLGTGDLVTDVFERAGELLVHGVAVKPGKPLVIGAAKVDGMSKLMIGLPGYPMSALSDYYIFVQPFIKRTLGLIDGPSYVDAEISRKHPSTVGRYEFLPVTLRDGLAIPLTKGSSSISSLAEADGFVEIDENTEVVEKGQRVQVRLF